MHQSIPAASISPATAGHFLASSVPGVWNQQFYVAMGSGICQNRGYSLAFGTHVVDPIQI